MEKKEYWIGPLYGKDSKRLEVSIRRFLLKNSDVLRLTRMCYRENFFNIKGDNHDPIFIHVKKNLQKYFIKKVRSNKRFNDISQGKNISFEHYFYKLSKKIRDLINKETLFYYVPALHPKDNFYGFEDPTFYKKDRMIGCVISHEKMVAIYLSDYEKNTLEKKSISFISTEN